MRDKPQLRKCLSRCRHCGIFFLTHPRNAGRRDLGCAFGCKQEHRRLQSIRRSTEYYKGESGRNYKWRSNQRQRGRAEIIDPQPAAPPAQPAASAGHDGSLPSGSSISHSPAGSREAATPGGVSGSAFAALCPFAPPCPLEPLPSHALDRTSTVARLVIQALPAAKDPELIAHIRTVVSLFEGRPIGLDVIWPMLLKGVRQHSIPKDRPIGHAIAGLNARPP